MEINNPAEQFNKEKKISKRASKYVMLKKIGLYCLSPVLVSVSFLFTIFWSVTAPFREIIVMPLYGSTDAEGKSFRCGYHAVCLLVELITFPFQIVAWFVCTPYLLCIWIKSALIGFKKLVDYVFSNQEKILASNRLQIVDGYCERNKFEFGDYAETGVGATLGYATGVYNFDVSLSKKAPAENQAPILEGERRYGCKWY